MRKQFIGDRELKKRGMPFTTGDIAAQFHLTPDIRKHLQNTEKLIAQGDYEGASSLTKSLLEEVVDSRLKNYLEKNLDFIQNKPQGQDIVAEEKKPRPVTDRRTKSLESVAPADKPSSPARSEIDIEKIKEILTAMLPALVASMGPLVKELKESLSSLPAPRSQGIDSGSPFLGASVDHLYELKQKVDFLSEKLRQMEGSGFISQKNTPESGDTTDQFHLISVFEKFLQRIASLEDKILDKVTGSFGASGYSSQGLSGGGQPYQPERPFQGEYTISLDVADPEKNDFLGTRKDENSKLGHRKNETGELEDQPKLGHKRQVPLPPMIPLPPMWSGPSSSSFPAQYPPPAQQPQTPMVSGDQETQPLSAPMPESRPLEPVSDEPRIIQGVLRMEKEEESPYIKLTYDFQKLPYPFDLSRDNQIFEYAYYKYKPMLLKAWEFVRKRQLKKALNYYRTIMDQPIPQELQNMIAVNIKDITQYMEKYLRSDFQVRYFRNQATRESTLNAS